MFLDFPSNPRPPTLRSERHPGFGVCGRLGFLRVPVGVWGPGCACGTLFLSLLSPVLGVSEGPTAQLPFTLTAPLLQTHSGIFCLSLGPLCALQMQAASREIRSHHLQPRAPRASVMSISSSGWAWRPFLYVEVFVLPACEMAPARWDWDQGLLLLRWKP